MYPSQIAAALASSTPASLPIWLTSLILLAFLAFYGWLALRTSSHAALGAQPFGLPDAICSGVLAVWMISVICQSIDSTQIITPKAIAANSVVYISLVLGIFGVIGFQGISAPSLFRLQPSQFPKAAIMGLLWLIITYPPVSYTHLTLPTIYSV